MDRRTEDQRLRGVVPLTWGGMVREVPTLKRGPSRAWKAELAKALGDLGTLGVGTTDALAQAGNLASDRMLELVRAYDTTGVLGTEEWIDENVDDSEVYGAFRALLEVAYPFVSDLRGVLTEVRSLGALALANPSASQDSTNGASPSGVSPRQRSTRG